MTKPTLCTLTPRPLPKNLEIPWKPFVTLLGSPSQAPDQTLIGVDLGHLRRDSGRPPVTETCAYFFKEDDLCRAHILEIPEKERSKCDLIGSVANTYAGCHVWVGFQCEDQAMNDFKGRHFSGEVVLWAVRWYCRYGLSYRDLETMMAERGVRVDHSTIYRWVQRYAPEMERRMRWQWRRPMSDSWRVDETYIKVRGKWTYLYRAVDKLGNTVDFYLSSTRNAKAAKRFLGKAIRACKDWEKPSKINTDKAGCYIQAIRELKKEGKCPRDVEHRQVKYLNNVIEADQGKLKQLIKPVRGFKTMRTAYATIKGFEVMRALRKGQGRTFNLTRDPIGEKRMIERAFGVGPCVMTEAMTLIEEHFKAAA